MDGGGQLRSWRILLDGDRGWTSHRTPRSSVHAVGHGWRGKEFVRARALCQAVEELFWPLLHGAGGEDPAETVRRAAASLRGHFAFIVETDRFVLACVDHARSIPLFYSHPGGELLLSNSAMRLKNTVSLAAPCPESMLECLMAGYVLESRTLVRDLFQMQAGEYLFWDKGGGGLRLGRHSLFFPDPDAGRAAFGEDDWMESLDAVSKAIFSKTVESLQGRPVYIPLSGGLDSRFVLAGLLECKYDNLHTFTYGMGQLWEVAAAKHVAELAGVPWTHIEYRPSEIRRRFGPESRRRYFEFASGLCSVPIVTDIHALQVLQREFRMPDDALILNGQSGDFVNGGHLSGDLFAAQQEIPVSKVAAYAVDRHFSLWRQLKTPLNKEEIAGRILRGMGVGQEAVLPAQEAASRYELFEWAERQCKYVVNGQRMYEWCGLEWRLPLWETEFFDFWKNVPLEYKLNQRLFKIYLDTVNPLGLFGKGMHSKKNYMPTAFIFPQLVWQVICNIFSFDRDYIKRKYMNYYSVYSPFYIQDSYFEYLRDSYYHRNYISYLSRELTDFVSKG